MADLFPSAQQPISIDDELSEVERELQMRRRVYPRWVLGQKMTQWAADRQIAVLEAIQKRLREIKARREA